MKVKVEIDLGEEYPVFDEDGALSIAASIQEAIVQKVRSEVLSLIRKESIDQVSAAVIKAVTEEREAKISEMVYNAIHNNKVRKRYSGNEMITLAEHIDEELKGSHLSDGNVRQMLDKAVKTTAAEMATMLKERYDLLFASQIVTRLNEQGMLKDEVAKILLGGAPSQG